MKMNVILAEAKQKLKKQQKKHIQITLENVVKKKNATKIKTKLQEINQKLKAKPNLQDYQNQRQYANNKLKEKDFIQPNENNLKKVSYPYNQKKNQTQSTKNQNISQSSNNSSYQNAQNQEHSLFQLKLTINSNYQQHQQQIKLNVSENPSYQNEQKKLTKLSAFEKIMKSGKTTNREHQPFLKTENFEQFQIMQEERNKSANNLKSMQIENYNPNQKLGYQQLQINSQDKKMTNQKIQAQKLRKGEQTNLANQQVNFYYCPKLNSNATPDSLSDPQNQKQESQDQSQHKIYQKLTANNKIQFNDQSKSGFSTQIQSNAKDQDQTSRKKIVKDIYDYSFNDGNSQLDLNCDESLEFNPNNNQSDEAKQDNYQQNQSPKEQELKKFLFTEENEQNDKIEEELKNFAQTNQHIVDSDTLTYLIQRENQYQLDQNYYLKFKQNQPHLTSIMRSILIDWMMEVCMEFTLKRETFYLAINYLNRYLQFEHKIEKMELQLIGVASMFLAAKVEEIYPPKIYDFARSTDNGYTTQQIQEMEFKILKTLKWLLNPPTLNMWANWYMTQWDIYIEHAPYACNHQFLTYLASKNNQYVAPLQFKQGNEQCYSRYRELMQILDLMQLELKTLQFKERALLAATMYLIIGRNYGQFSVEDIVNQFSKSSHYLLGREFAFNDLFQDFVNFSFGFELIDLLPYIQFSATFFLLPIQIDLPTAAKINRENVLEGHFEEFLAYQTHHPLNLAILDQRNQMFSPFMQNCSEIKYQKNPELNNQHH